MKRDKTVSLIVGDKKEEFEFEHAERILMMPNNGGWHLPEDSPYELTDHGLDNRGNKGPGKKSEEK